VKVFLDECVDWRLARDIVGHDVKTARQMGWTTIKNGTLLTLASWRSGFGDGCCRGSAVEAPPSVRRREATLSASSGRIAASGAKSSIGTRTAVSAPRLLTICDFRADTYPRTR
jgi:hypothetical protein